MPRRGERDLLNAYFPDDPIPGIIGGLLILALAGGIGDGTLIWARAYGGGAILLLGAALVGATHTLTSLNKLRAFLRYERRFEPDPALRPSHRWAAYACAVLAGIVIAEAILFVVALR